MAETVNIQIPYEELRKRKIFLGVPMYGGACAGMFAKSLSDLAALCVHHGIYLQQYFLFNESLVQRARNYVVDEFLRSDCTHLMFIDADIGFNANDVITLLALQSDDSEYDVLCGPYPKKCISFEKIKAAVDHGFADNDPQELEKFVGDYVFNPVAGQQQIPLNQPVEVMESGTGFMMIRRATFDKFREAFPHTAYLPDHVRTQHFDGTRSINAYFDCVIDPKSKRYLSEDYYFCQKTREIGLKVWLCPWIQLHHVGSYVFGGSLADLARIGAAATADPSKLKKNG